MKDEPLDALLLTKVMGSVRVHVQLPMRVRIAKVVKGKLQDSHEMEIPPSADVPVIQKEVTKIALQWKGGFEVGTVYTVERLA